MRTGLVIDSTLRAIDDDGTIHRKRVLDLIVALADEVHRTGLVRDHADQTAKFGYDVNDIGTCGYPLCIDALNAIKDITNIAAEFPTASRD